MLTVRYALLCKIILFILFVLQLYLTSMIKISNHVIIKRCFNNPFSINFSLYMNHFSLEFIIFFGAFAEHLRKANISFVMSVCLSVRPHGTTLLLLVGFRDRLCCGFLLKSVDQIQVLFLPVWGGWTAINDGIRR